MQDDNRECFNVGHGGQLGTKETCAQKGRWRGVYEDFTVIDTPGFGVIANDDTFDTNYKHARSVVEYLKENTPSITTFLICIHGQYPRISNGLRLMLVQLENIFGEDFWKNVVLEFTHYGFSDEEINERSYSLSNSENERKLEMNRMLKGYFGFQVRPINCKHFQTL